MIINKIISAVFLSRASHQKTNQTECGFRVPCRNTFDFIKLNSCHLNSIPPNEAGAVRLGKNLV
jgi:hypothetical protein